jgi:Endodeoxyribonuclease RusA
MPRDLALPFAFAVKGVPVSDQSENDRARYRWKREVAESAKRELPKKYSLVEEAMSVTIVYFYIGETDLDVDNIPKLILDALKGVIYADDKKIEQILVRKTKQGRGLDVIGPSNALLDALGWQHDFVYIEIRDAPNHLEMP